MCRNESMEGLYAITITLVLFAILCVKAEDHSNGWGDNINWKSFDEGVKESQKMKKPVMLVIHKSWCGACKALKPKFAASKEIEELSSNFVMINTVDDQEPQDPKFSPDGGYIPRILFMDHNGDIQSQLYHEGGNDRYKYYYHHPDAIVRSMKRAAEELQPVIISDEL